MTPLDIGLLLWASFATTTAILLGGVMAMKLRPRPRRKVKPVTGTTAKGWVVVAQTHECDPPKTVRDVGAGLGSVWACECGAEWKIERWYGGQRGQPTWERIKKGHGQLT